MSKKKPKYELVPVTESAVAVADEPDVSDFTEAENQKDSRNESPTKFDRKYDKWLRCDLSESEKQNAAANLVNRMEDLTRKEAELDSIKNQFKGEIARITADIEASKNLVRDGYVMRDVQVLEERDFKTETMTITRLDTFEIVEERKLRGEELQRPLFGDE